MSDRLREVVGNFLAHNEGMDGDMESSAVDEWCRDLRAALATPASAPVGERDARRIDWLEAHAKRRAADYEAGIRVEYFVGGEIYGADKTGFYVREWGDVPRDDEGELDFSRRTYRATHYDTLREAIDAAQRSEEGR